MSARFVSQPPVISITQEGQYYLITFPYNQEVLDLFKRHIPATHRTFSQFPKGWLIHPNFIDIACQQLEAVYGGSIKRPGPITGKAEVTTETFEIEYIGLCKDRGQGKSSAYGATSPKVWSVEFPENILKKFFGDQIELGKTQENTLYQVLLIGEKATPVEIKQAYRRMALQWHPDKCREENAQERFIEIDQAYKLLSDPIQKSKYDAGLYFQRQTESPAAKYTPLPDDPYRSPLRCGLVTVKGVQGLGRFEVSDILNWEDLRDDRGKIAVVSWLKTQQTYHLVWA